jgi:hypothetical protein
LGEAAHQAPAAAIKPAAKPKPKVTPLRPLDALGAALDDPPIAAEGAPGAAPPPPPPEDLPPAEPGGGRSGGERPKGEIWRGCPVRPLGVNGATYYYLDIHGQLRAIAKHDAQSILMLFGHRIPALCYAFAQWGKDEEGRSYRKPGRFDQTTAAMEMIAACSEHGLFDPENAVRGVGAWADDDGTLIYHAGDKLYLGKTELDPGTHQGRIYPAAPPVPHPLAADKDVSDPMAVLTEVLSTWQWTRPDLDPMICLGLMGVQMFGGAMSWRPAYWITGGAGAGKSALQRLMLHLHGGEKGLIQSTDATARGIASLLGQSTLPVALDELEPGDQGSTKERDIVATARVAASGGRWARGSSDQKGSTGQLRSTFLFSSILVPGVLKSQDLQRIILLSLDPFPDGAKAPDLRAEIWRKRGAAIKRLILDRWPSWAARLELWREAFAEHGVQGRDADNWATTMAMAQMMRAEALPQPDELKGWAAKVAKAIRASLGEASNDSDEVLTHFLSQRLDVFRRGQTYTLAQWLMVAASLPGAPAGLLDGYATDANGKEQRAKAANAHLAPYMIRVVQERGADPRLFVGNKKVQPLLDLFAGTQWAGGAWAQSLARIKGAIANPVSRTLAGVSSRGWEIPLSAIAGLEVFPQDRAEAPAAAHAPVDMEDWQ